MVLPARGDTPSDNKKAVCDEPAAFLLLHAFQRQIFIGICFQCASMVELCLRGEEFKLDHYLDIK